MVDSFEMDAADLGGRARLLDQHVALVENLHMLRLVLEHVPVLVVVRVAGLEHLGELLVQTLHGCQVTPSDLFVSY